LIPFSATAATGWGCGDFASTREAVEDVRRRPGRMVNSEIKAEHRNTSWYAAIVASSCIRE
jgi:hypothetical protein